MPREFLDRWDPWLQECVHVSRTSLQQDWLPRYLTSPVWRFVLSEGVCGSGAYAGILMPSVDKVGRYFPLTILAQLDIETCVLQFAIRHAEWFGALETLAVSALEEPAFDLERFDVLVADSGAGLDVGLDATEANLDAMFAVSGFPAQGSAWRVPIRDVASLQSAINQFAYRELAAQMRPLSLWWSEGSGDVAPSWLVLSGLPTAQQYTALLDGNWARDGWQSLGELSPLIERARQPLASPVAIADVPNEALPAIRATYPDVQLSNIESNRAAFVLRPEIGLWAVLASPSGTSADGLRMIADALQQQPPAATLTGAVEALRNTLAEAQRRLRHIATRDVQCVESHVNLAAMLVSGLECALLSAGDVQKLRIRARVVEQFRDGAVENAAPPADAGSLMELLSSGARAMEGLGSENFTELRIHYERLQRDDLWILCAQAPISSRNLDYVTGAAASGLPLSASVVANMIGSGAHTDVVLPLITLET